MNKRNIIIAIVLVILVIGGIVFAITNGGSSKNGETMLKTSAEMIAAIEEIYSNSEMPLQSLATMEIDVSDTEMLQSFTGLESNKDIEVAVVSEPMISSQAYSLVMVKVSDKANVENIKKTMLDNINTRKWICVEAEKVYVTNNGSTICLVMASEQLAKPVYEAFKAYVNENVGTELERTAEVGTDMDFDMPIEGEVPAVDTDTGTDMDFNTPTEGEVPAVDTEARTDMDFNTPTEGETSTTDDE